jgi:hypothetical protein
MFAEFPEIVCISLVYPENGSEKVSNSLGKGVNSEKEGTIELQNAIQKSGPEQ